MDQKRELTGDIMLSFDANKEFKIHLSHQHMYTMLNMYQVGAEESTQMAGFM